MKYTSGGMEVYPFIFYKSLEQNQTAGHKGQPEVVGSLGRKGRRRKLRGKRGRGTLEGEKPLVLGLLQRSGEVVIQMVPNVQHVTIQPIITETIAPGTMIYTDEYDIYDSLPKWGYQHKSVNHAAFGLFRVHPQYSPSRQGAAPLTFGYLSSSLKLLKSQI